MPKCAWILLAAIALMLNQTIGLAATINFLFAAATWAITTPAVLVMIASLAAYHLLNFHAPHPRRRRPAHA